jgi:hypothetical protein
MLLWRIVSGRLIPRLPGNIPTVVPDLMNNKITGAEGMRKIIDEMNK